MTAKPALRAIVGALACILCGAVAAQSRFAPPHGGGGAPRGGFGSSGPPAGAFGMGGRGVPMRRDGAPYGVASPYGPPPRYAPPPPPRGYESPPLRRPYDAPPGWRAAPREPPGIARDLYGMDRPRMASLGYVIEGIQRRSPGRQLDSQVDYLDGRPVYRVRWLTVRGRRMDYIVDAETGVILSGR